MIFVKCALQILIQFLHVGIGLKLIIIQLINKLYMYTKTTVNFTLLLLTPVMARAAIVNIIWLFCWFKERRREGTTKTETISGSIFWKKTYPSHSWLTLFWPSIPLFVCKKNGVLNSELPTYKLSFGRNYVYFGIDCQHFSLFCGWLQLSSAFL